LLWLSLFLGKPRLPWLSHSPGKPRLIWLSLSALASVTTAPHTTRQASEARPIHGSPCPPATAAQSLAWGLFHPRTWNQSPTPTSPRIRISRCRWRQAHPRPKRWQTSKKNPFYEVVALCPAPTTHGDTHSSGELHEVAWSGRCATPSVATS